MERLIKQSCLLEGSLISSVKVGERWPGEGELFSTRTNLLRKQHKRSGGCLPRCRQDPLTHLLHLSPQEVFKHSPYLAVPPRITVSSELKSASVCRHVSVAGDIEFQSNWLYYI